MRARDRESEWKEERREGESERKRKEQPLMPPLFALELQSEARAAAERRRWISGSRVGSRDVGDAGSTGVAGNTGGSKDPLKKERLLILTLAHDVCLSRQFSDQGKG